MYIPKIVFLTRKSFGQLFLQAMRIQDFTNFSLEESKTASYKNVVGLRYVLWTSFFAFYCFIIAWKQAILSMINCWYKNFTNFKGLAENNVDLAFSLKSRALQFANLYSLHPSSINTFIAIPINAVNFTYSLSLSINWGMHCLRLKGILHFQDFFAGICIGSDTIKEMLLSSQSSKFKSTT